MNGDQKVFRRTPHYHPTMFEIRRAATDDLAEVLDRTRRLNLEEHIEIDPVVLEAATRRLLDTPELGAIWVVERDRVIVGHAVVTYGYDLEFGGRDSYLTELWIDPPVRGHGAATRLLEQIATELRGDDIRALHLQVRPDNPARRLYERTGFTVVPRVTMTRRL